MEDLMGKLKAAATTRDDKFGCAIRKKALTCNQCLEKASEIIFGDYKYHLGCFVINTRLVLRYEIHDFLTDPSAPSPIAYLPTSA
ncbi:hypothetical protein IEQ34_016854 [Dendrobium chrysotoxum]|uniref:Gnk2-homologous domain-containing protein n=1 Tax=Dendrobium chrysotoxum TaxID=161865 RepID=A0AAV7GFD7_DENCH|nr:hypothetical protein IEQ34_016854 [Dendrobium chrysotoxum]